MQSLLPFPTLYLTNASKVQKIVQIGFLNIDVHWWQDWRTLVRETTHTRNVIYAETCPINYTVAMGLLRGDIAAAWCVCVGHPDSAEMFRNIHPWPRTVFMIIWLITTSIASTQTSGHKPRKSEFRKLGMEREPSRGYTPTRYTHGRYFGVKASQCLIRIQ